MKEIVCVKLENEMDVILAHKRAMKLGELCGCSIVTQTSVATAVSEKARCVVEHGEEATLTFLIESVGNRKFFRAEVADTADFCSKNNDALTYAKRLVGDVQTAHRGKHNLVILRFQLKFSGTVTDARIKAIKDHFDNEPPLSSYDELRKRNQLLQDMADKISESEKEYSILSNSLPLMMFAVNSRGQVTFSNQWLQNFFGTTLTQLTPLSWQNVIHPSEYNTFTRDLQNMIATQSTLNAQYRFKEKRTGNFIWHLFSITPLKNENQIVTGWIGFLVDINAQKIVEQTLKDNKELKAAQQQLFEYQNELERKVIELNRSNYELEQFAHLASHDLQEPLRKVFFYSDILRKKYSAVLDSAGLDILNIMGSAARRMRELITDLLSYSQLHQQKLVVENVDINLVFADILRDLELNIKEKDAIINLGTLPSVQGNFLRLRQLFFNLVTNSLKYTRTNVRPVIDIGSESSDGEVKITVKDNGIGFRQEYAEKIFGLFERLHGRDKFAGTGIGLSICKKIVELHSGRIIATSKEGEYSIFEVSLPMQQKN